MKRGLVALAAAAALLGGCGDGGDEAPESFYTPVAPPATESTERLVPRDERGEVARVLAAIESGEQLAYPQDGGTFENREGLLPDEEFGYYREYTVPTPASPDRGARRLVIGEGGETYYTRDHYASFERIEPEDFTP